MNQHEPTTSADETLEELVAYLDGELTPQESRAVEEKLARDETYRLRLRDLQQADDVLDVLPRADVDENFTRSTVEIVALRVEDDIEEQEQQTSRTRWWSLGGLALGVLVALGVGYGVVGTLVSRPNEKLLRDLPVIDNIDLYRHAESIEFLRRLDHEQLFEDGEVSDGATS
jgi:anti-sigma factor RsiW